MTGAITQIACGIRVYPGDKAADPGKGGIITGFQGSGKKIQTLPLKRNSTNNSWNIPQPSIINNSSLLKV